MVVVSQPDFPPAFSASGSNEQPNSNSRDGKVAMSVKTPQDQSQSFPLQALDRVCENMLADQEKRVRHVYNRELEVLFKTFKHFFFIKFVLDFY